ncbi:hypothetical protein IE81DRAFT_253473 [Ceraceosorus guamensis]|uniref:Uncharacterized protein n=1 Tax=Ceraceosorus guamensis TaxID=1522189 RepID=A0A316W4T1_9BASI|nr:hypothetical protein IE81DRAFT_253473 [Ceraceosorus guamensis]PWN44732.1 hypothetical protein IE81DRAFT_253473 [Ceraceosorus guamensis]
MSARLAPSYIFFCSTQTSFGLTLFKFTVKCIHRLPFCPPFLTVSGPSSHASATASLPLLMCTICTPHHTPLRRCHLRMELHLDAIDDRSVISDVRGLLRLLRGRVRWKRWRSQGSVNHLEGRPRQHRVRWGGATCSRGSWLCCESV